MHIIGAQYNKHNGPDGASQHKLEFTIDESQQESLYNFCKSVKKGTELLMLIFEANTEEEEIKELVNENPTQTRQRLNKRMHAMIREIANVNRHDPSIVKKTLKEFLIKKQYIKQSTSELDLKGLCAAIYYLSTEYGLEQG